MSKYVLKVFVSNKAVKGLELNFKENDECKLARIDYELSKFENEKELMSFIESKKHFFPAGATIKLYDGNKEIPIFYNSDHFIKHVAKESLDKKKEKANIFLNKYFIFLTKDKDFLDYIDTKYKLKSLEDIITMIKNSIGDDYYNSHGTSVAKANLDEKAKSYTIIRELYQILCEYNLESNKNLDVSIKEKNNDLFSVITNFDDITIIKERFIMSRAKDDLIDNHDRDLWEQFPEGDIHDLYKEGIISESFYREYIESGHKKKN